MVGLARLTTRPRGHAKRKFWTVLLFAAALTLAILISRRIAPQSPVAASSLLSRAPDEECRLVHEATDQCKYVQEHCPDEEAGLLSYLQLYYCKLPHVRGVALIIIALWLCLLFSTIGIAASDFFSVNLSTIAALLGLSENLAGVTFLAIGNGSPDVFSTFAAMNTNSGSLAVGELIGAAGFITAAVSGSMALVRPFEVARASFVRDIVFFIFATILAMVFLFDGELRRWECILMVVFYLVYVVVVVAWHWISGRRNARKMQEATARQQFLASDAEPQLQSSVERTVGGRGESPGRISHLSNDAQFRLLESAGLDDGDDDVEERSRQQAVSEINRNMRVNRPRHSTRRLTRNTIRPSLVGALEFRAVLSSLEKSRSQQSVPIHLRRYSDDPSLRQFRQPAPFSPRPASTGPDDPHATSQGQSQHLQPYGSEATTARGRYRAASTGDVAALQSMVDEQPHTIIDSAQGNPTNSTGILPEPRGGLGNHAAARDSLHPSLGIETNQQAAQSSEAAIDQSPPVAKSPGNALSATQTKHLDDPIPRISRRASSGLLLAPETGGSSPSTPFPHYHDDPSPLERLSRTSSIRLPPPSLGIDLNASTDDLFAPPPKHISWWPYKLLPAPQVLFSTLFPTLYSWPHRNSWERLIGIVAAPSIFVLTITLPVVEDKTADDVSDYEAVPTDDIQEPSSPRSVPNPPLISIEGPSEAVSIDSSSENLGGSETATNTLNTSAQDVNPLNSPVLPDTSDQGWNRWLVCTQIIMAPIFVAWILWANTDKNLSLRNLALLEAYVMTGALATLALALYTTSPDKPPRFRPILSFVGFVVSVAWISTIANEVVGVLKALGVILGISDAILGLTIFAVGNSLGDLVADVTIARLGYPVMALGACIGGPMLNILLGIGIGGLYMTIRDGESHGGAYHIQVGGMLIISSIALLITLVGLLIVVPLNKWILDRKIGLGLIALWCVSTIVNVVLETTGTVTTVAFIG